MNSLGSLIVSEYVLYVLGTLTISFILYQIRVHRMLSTLQHQQDKLETILFGSEIDQTDQGWIPESKNEIENINYEIKTLNKNIEKNNEKLDEINNKLDNQRDSQDKYSE